MTGLSQHVATIHSTFSPRTAWTTDGRMALNSGVVRTNHDKLAYSIMSEQKQRTEKNKA